MLCLVVAATMVSTLLGGRLALRLRHQLDLVVSYSAGAVIGLALLDLLPEAIALSVPPYRAARLTSLVALGFLLFMLINRAVAHWSEDGPAGEDRHDPGGRHAERGARSRTEPTLIVGRRGPRHGEVGAAGLCVHSVLDGMGIGLGLKVSYAVGLIITAGVITHDFADGVNTVSMILSHRGTVRQASGWLVADAAAPALGALSTLFFTLSRSELGLVLALFAGFFLYVGASELLPEGHRRSRNLWPVLLTLLGAGTLYVATRLSQL